MRRSYNLIALAALFAWVAPALMADVQAVPAPKYQPVSEIPTTPHIFIGASYSTAKGIVQYTVAQNWKGENYITVVEGGALGLMLQKPIASVTWADDGLSVLVTSKPFDTKKDGVCFVQAALSASAGKWVAQFTVFKADGSFLGKGSLLKAATWTLKAPAN